jgi:hypothetical protein
MYYAYHVLDLITLVLLGGEYKLQRLLCNFCRPPINSSSLRPNILLVTTFSNSSNIGDVYLLDSAMNNP